MEELFLSVLNMSLTASYVIIFVMLVRLPLKMAPKVISYALWGVVAFRLLCPFSFESMFSLLPTNATAIPHDIAYQQSPQINSGIIAIDTYVNRSLPSPSVTASVNPLQIYTLIGSSIWILGIVVMLVYSVISVLILKRRLKNAQHIEHNICEADNLKTPFVLGIFRPIIYIPTALTAEEKIFIIRHEQTHVGRFDHIIKPFAFCVLSIHWFNPLVWIAFLLMSSDMELSCDEKVIKEMGSEIKKAYSTSLLSLAMEKSILNGSPLAFGEGNVKGRIKNVLNYRKPSFWIIMSALIAVGVVSIGLLANPKNNEPALNEEGPVSYGIIKLQYGEVLRSISPLSGDKAQFAEDITINYMIKSAAWPGVDIKTLEECYLLRATYPNGTLNDYYAYLLDGKAVMQRGTEGFYSRIDDGLYEKLIRLTESSTATVGGVNEPINITTSIDRNNLNACITDAILTANADRSPQKSDFAAEAHTIFKTVEDGSTTTVYGLALYLEFGYADGALYETGGSHVPIALTFKKNADDAYELVEYWKPGAGSEFAPSVRSKFPSDIYEDAIDTQKYVVAHMQSCYEQAIEYGKVNVDVEIAKLIEMITSSPAEMSNPQAYIKEHVVEYRKLIYYGKYTLRYCFNLFEKGGQTNLDGHIMAAACRDILGKEDIDILANTGQDWYDDFKKHVENLSDKNGKDYMKKNMPSSWILLQVLDSTSN